MLSSFSCVRLCATLQAVASQAPLFVEFSRQEYWNGLLCPPWGDLSWPRDRTRISHVHLRWWVGSLPLTPLGKPLYHLSPYLNVENECGECRQTMGLVLNKPLREFPGGPVVRTLHFHCWGPGFDHWSGNWDPTSHAAWPKNKAGLWFKDESNKKVINSGSKGWVSCQNHIATGG